MFLNLGVFSFMATITEERDIFTQSNRNSQYAVCIFTAWGLVIIVKRENKAYGSNKNTSSAKK